MKRRQFIQRAGWAVAGAAPALPLTGFPPPASAGPSAQPPVGADSVQQAAQRVLVTRADTPLGQAVAADLAARYDVRRTSSATARGDSWIANNLGSPDAARELLDGVGQIVHPTGFARGGDGVPLDLPARETYHLLTAAAAAGVTRVVCLSTLELVSGYDASFAVREDWRPVPAAEPAPLSAWLVECVCREFAREGRLDVIVLRLGRLDGSPPATDARNAVPRVEAADAARAVASALAAKSVQDPRGPRGWDLVHVHSEPRQPRFPLDQARRALGFQPAGS